MARIIFWVVILGGIGSLVYFALQKEVPVAVHEGAVKAGAFNPEKLQENFLKYGYQFGGITEEQYWADARDFLNAPLTRGMIQRIKPNGDIQRFRISSGEYAVMNNSGQILTYFKTDYQHWIDEKLSKRGEQDIIRQS